MARRPSTKRSLSATTLDKIMQVRINKDVHKQFVALASIKGMSAATYVRVLMLNALENHQKG